MQPLKAHVKNGPLVMDEPTDLPEGEVVGLVLVDDGMDSHGSAPFNELSLRPEGARGRPSG